MLGTARHCLTELHPSIPSVVPVTLDGWKGALSDAGLMFVAPLLMLEFEDALDPVNLTDASSLCRRPRVFTARRGHLFLTAVTLF